MSRILRMHSAAALPLRRQRTYRVLQDQQPPALLRRELQLVGRLPPAPAARVVLRPPRQALAQQRAGGDAVRASITLEAQRDDAIVAHACAEIEPYALI